MAIDDVMWRTGVVEMLMATRREEQIEEKTEMRWVGDWWRSRCLLEAVAMLQLGKELWEATPLLSTDALNF